MNRTLATVLLLVLMGMIAILWPNPAISKSESQFMWLIHNDSHISVVYDKATHCQYLVYDGFRSGE